MLLGALLLTGCATERDAVKIDDSGVASLNVRAVLPLTNQDRRHAMVEGRPEDGIGGQSSIELEYTFLEDDADQSLGPDDSIELDGEVFDGPGGVDYRYRVAAFALAFHAMQVFESGVAFGGFGGLSSHTLELDGKFEGTRDSVDVFSVGPYFGGEVRWYAPARFHLFARLTFSYEIPDERQSVETRGVELGGVYHFSRYFSLGAGYRWWRYEAKSDGDFESDLELDADGPLLTLGFSP